jgi:FlaA1/EpsC-like NDP-sugar epimerase
MPVIRIIDLAQIMIEVLAPRYGYDPAKIELKFIGAKPGEKMYEELMSQEETTRSMEIEEMFVTLPAFRFMYRHVEHVYPGLIKDQVEKPYNSETETALSSEELKTFLIESGIAEFNDLYEYQNPEVKVI